MKLKSLSFLAIFIFPVLTASAGKPSYQDRRYLSRLKYLTESLQKRCPLSGGLDKNALRNCKYAHQRAQKGIKLVKVNVHTRAPYKALARYISTLNIKIPAWEAQLAKGKANRRLSRKYSRNFDRLFRKHQRFLYVLSQMDAGKKPPLISERLMQFQIRNIKRFKAFIDWCSKREYVHIRPSYKYKGYRSPAKACSLAKNWKPLYKRYLDSTVKRLLNKKASYLKGYLSNLKTSFKTSDVAMGLLKSPKEFTQKLKKAFTPVYTFIGAKFPTKNFAAYIATTKSFSTLLKKARRKFRYPRKKARYSCRSCKRAMRAAGRGKGFTLKRAGMMFRHWTIKKNRYKRPLKKYRTGWALYKKRGERFCRVYRLTVNAQYKGGGRYTRPFLPDDILRRQDFIVSKCR